MSILPHIGPPVPGCAAGYISAAQITLWAETGGIVMGSPRARIPLDIEDEQAQDDTPMEDLPQDSAPVETQPQDNAPMELVSNEDMVPQQGYGRGEDAEPQAPDSDNEDSVDMEED